MKKKNSAIKKINTILNTSSETFMLIALVSLFALPFVVWSNLDPIVKEAETTALRARVPNTAQVAKPQNLPQASSEQNITASDVLGINTVNKPFSIEENKPNLSYFDSANADLKDNSYSLTLKTNQVYGRIALFTLKNESASKQSYSFNALNNNGSGDKVIFVDNKQYTVGGSSLPDQISLEAGDKIQISLMSNQSRDTDVVVTVSLVEAQ